MPAPQKVNIADRQPEEWEPDSDNDVTFRNLLSRDITDSINIVQGIATLGEGDVEKAHWHEIPETIHVLSGSGSATVDGKKYELNEGDTFFVPPRIVHEWRSEEGTMRFLYTFPADDFSDIAYHHVGDGDAE
ncbi:cupin domain-containing protein [Aquicoccus sp. SCR17]|nr:cupin domain-containing protein [Carideicomes alvinocaridis]